MPFDKDRSGAVFAGGGDGIFPRKKTYSFDPKCQELAEHFLPSGVSERLVKDLAQAIQDAVEDHCELEWIKHSAP
jgi:hypothetical protein